jgi:hypothetical protein
MRPWVGRRQQPELPGVPAWKILVVLLVSKRRASVSSAEGHRLRILSSSINLTFQVALLLGGYSTSAFVRCPLSFKPPSPTGSALPVCLRLTSRRSASRPSLKVRWLRLIMFRSRILLEVVAPCLHFKPLDLLSRDLMFIFVCVQEDFLLWIPMHPT